MILKNISDATDSDRQIQMDTIGHTMTDQKYRDTQTNRQIIVNFCVLQPQIVCENLDCLQVWLERIELIWSPDQLSAEPLHIPVSLTGGAVRSFYFMALDGAL